LRLDCSLIVGNDVYDELEEKTKAELIEGVSDGSGTRCEASWLDKRAFRTEKSGTVVGGWVDSYSTDEITAFLYSGIEATVHTWERREFGPSDDLALVQEVGFTDVDGNVFVVTKVDDWSQATTQTNVTRAFDTGVLSFVTTRLNSQEVRFSPTGFQDFTNVFDTVGSTFSPFPVYQGAVLKPEGTDTFTHTISAVAPDFTEFDNVLFDITVVKTENLSVKNGDTNSFQCFNPSQSFPFTLSVPAVNSTANLIEQKRQFEYSGHRAFPTLMIFKWDRKFGEP